VELDLEEVLSGTLQLLQPEADRSGLRLSLELDPECPRRVRGDPIRIRQVLLNLGSNAVKFTKQGGVTFGLRRLEEEEGRVRVALSVCDTGIGIPPGKISRIFEAFTQLDSSTTREYGGTGLGLTIARRLALLMGGQLEAESREGEGSTFSLVAWFPRA
jgi:two-component system, sensor histidine kinase and response regulator